MFPLKLNINNKKKERKAGFITNIRNLTLCWETSGLYQNILMAFHVRQTFFPYVHYSCIQHIDLWSFFFCCSVLWGAVHEVQPPAEHQTVFSPHSHDHKTRSQFRTVQDGVPLTNEQEAQRPFKATGDSQLVTKNSNTQKKQVALL